MDRIKKALFFSLPLTLWACQNRTPAQYDLNAPPQATQTPAQNTSCPHTIMARSGSQTYRLESINTTGTNAIIYKLRGDPNPENIYKIERDTENAQLNYELEADFFTKLKPDPIGPYLVETIPVTFTVKQKPLRGFIKRFVRGKTLRELGTLNPSHALHQDIDKQLTALYGILDKMIRIDGKIISDIHDDNVIWDETKKRLVIIDGHYDSDAKSQNPAGYFVEQCRSWPWCHKKLHVSVSKKK